MRSLSSVGLGLSIVFGCLLLALVAELYYLLWWKRRLTNTETEDDFSGSARELLYMHCWKKPSSTLSSSRPLNPQQLCSSSSSDRFTDAHVVESHQSLQINHFHGNKDFLLKAFGEETMEIDQLMALQHDLSGPPRFLFTIKEETKEDLDLESEDGKSRDDKSVKGSRSRSLSDLLLTVETPFLTPLASPPFFTPPLTPMDSAYNHRGVNPLFESATDHMSDQLISRVSSSPPPKFKFLKDAEEKLQRKVMEEDEEAKKEQLQLESVCASDNIGIDSPSTSKLQNKDEEEEEEDGSFITIVVAKNKERQLIAHHSSSSQILPLVSSPSTFNPPVCKKPILHHISTN